MSSQGAAPRPLPVPMPHHLAPSPVHQHDNAEQRTMYLQFPHEQQLHPLPPDLFLLHHPGRPASSTPIFAPNKMSLSYILHPPTGKPSLGHQSVAHALVVAPPFPHIPKKFVPTRVASPFLERPESLSGQNKILDRDLGSMPELSGATEYPKIFQNICGQQEQRPVPFRMNADTRSFYNQTKELAQSSPDFHGRDLSKSYCHVYERHRKRPWTAHEDAQLRTQTTLIRSGLWTEIAKHIPGRSGKQVRERWVNHLSPTVVRRPWSKDEDQAIMDAVLEIGTSWTKISKMLPGRSANSIKNRYYGTLRNFALNRGTVKSGDWDKLNIQPSYSQNRV